MSPKRKPKRKRIKFTNSAKVTVTALSILSFVGGWNLVAQIESKDVQADQASSVPPVPPVPTILPVLPTSTPWPAIPALPPVPPIPSLMPTRTWQQTAPIVSVDSQVSSPVISIEPAPVQLAPLQIAPLPTLAPLPAMPAMPSLPVPPPVSVGGGNNNSGGS